MELLNKLGIDWKLLLAQIVNFAILAFVLYKFVYKIVLDTLEKRSRMIEKGVHDARASGEKLMQIEKLAEQRMLETERQVGVLLEKARKDADLVKQGIMAEANAQADDFLRRTRSQIAEEKEKMLVEVRAEVSTLVVKLTAKLLTKEFSATDQKRLSDAIAVEMSAL